jgi:hypothetical protein
VYCDIGQRALASRDAFQQKCSAKQAAQISPTPAYNALSWSNKFKKTYFQAYSSRCHGTKI